MKFCASHKIALQAVSQHCANKFYKVFALKHENGSIGGYLLQPAIRDAPVSYLDCHGNFLVSLHVFGSDEEKAKANGIIEPLNTLFPRQEPLSCPVFESPAMPANEGT